MTIQVDLGYVGGLPVSRGAKKSETRTSTEIALGATAAREPKALHSSKQPFRQEHPGLGIAPTAHPPSIVLDDHQYARHTLKETEGSVVWAESTIVPVPRFGRY